MLEEDYGKPVFTNGNTQVWRIIHDGHTLAVSGWGGCWRAREVASGGNGERSFSAFGPIGMTQGKTISDRCPGTLAKSRWGDGELRG